MKITYRNKAIHFTTEGSGETLVLLHGFLESKEIWEDFFPDFLTYGRIVTIDLPGHGSSEVIEEVHSMELMAESVKKVLDHLNIHKANFIGHSMGGYVALSLLEQYPGMVNDLMLLNSTPLADTEEKRTNRDRAIQVVEKNKQAYISMAISNLLSPENHQKYVKEINIIKSRAYNFPTEGITAALKGMKIRTDKRGVLKNFKGVKTIVAGKNDPLIEVNSIKSVADECNCTFFLLPGGHLSYLESKNQFIKLCISSKK